MDSPYGPLCNSKGHPIPTSWAGPLNMTSRGCLSVKSWGRPCMVLYVTLRGVPYWLPVDISCILRTSQYGLKCDLILNNKKYILFSSKNFIKLIYDLRWNYFSRIVRCYKPLTIFAKNLNRGCPNGLNTPLKFYFIFHQVSNFLTQSRFKSRLFGLHVFFSFFRK